MYDSQDCHEICFVGDEAFRELSMMDPNGNDLLDKVIGYEPGIHGQAVRELGL